MPVTGHKHGWKTDRPKRKFENCRDAGRQMQNEADSGKDWSWADWDVQATAGEVNFTHADDGSSTATVTIRRKLSQDTSTVTVPEPTWPDMSEEDQEGVKSTTDAATAHEDGHMQIASDTAEAWGNGDGTKDLQATGRSDDEASRNLQKEVNSDAAAFKEQLDSRQAEYDGWTSHGIHQSKGPEHRGTNGEKDPFPGGKDVVLNCH